MQTFYIMFLSIAGIGFVPVGGGTTASIASVIPLLTITLVSPTIAKVGIVGGLFMTLSGFALVAIQRSTRVPRAHYDQGFIVIDEAIGMIVAFMPIFFYQPSTFLVSLTIALFRFFDIVKPLGISYIDKKNTPLSVILDDILAGGYTAVCIVLIFRFILLS